MPDEKASEWQCSDPLLCKSESDSSLQRANQTTQFVKLKLETTQFVASTDR